MSARRENEHLLPLSDEQWGQLEDVLARFEASWCASAPPCFDGYLPDSSPLRLPALIELMLADIALRRRAGEPAPAQAYLDRYPELARNEGVWRLLEDAAHADTSPPGPGTHPSIPDVAGDGPDIPGYEVNGVLGRGGMGVVYDAWDRKLRRRVALKMIVSGALSSPEAVTRFRNEAETIARLQHPNVVQVYEVGEHHGQHYFSLEYCAGGSLEKRLDTGPLPSRQAARLVETLARAVQAAHRANVVHRDLKPGNVLLTADGTPKITDFGLAKQLDDDTGRTASGVVMGTPNYMAPEQARAQKDVGPAADVWALGAILYECLTGRPPFKAATSVDTIVKVVSEEPVPPRQLNANVPRDLETICLKCLSKRPQDRYPSALQLAQELERFGAGETIVARPPGLVQKLGRRLRRYGWQVGVVLAVTVAVVLPAVVWHYAERERQVSRLVQGLEEALGSGDAAARAQEMEQLLADLERLGPAQADPVRRRAVRVLTAWVERGLATRSRLSEVDIRGLEDAVRCLEGLDAGRAEEMQAACRHRFRSWQTVIDLAAPFAGLPEVFGPAAGVSARDGRLYRAVSPVQTLVPCRGNLDVTATFGEGWDNESAVGLLLNAHLTGRTADCMACSTDGRWLAVGLSDGTVELRDLSSGELRRELAAHEGAVGGVAFTPDSATLATAGHDGKVKLWDLATPRPRRVLSHKGRFVGLTISRDGSRLAAVTGPGNGEAACWGLGPGASDTPLSCGLNGPSAAFSPDGKVLYVPRGTTRVAAIDAASGKQIYVYGAGHFGVWAVACSPDGRTVASVLDGTSRLLFQDAANGHPSGEVGLYGLLGGTRCLAYSPDGGQVAVGCDSGHILVHDVKRGETRVILEALQGPVTAVAFAPDGRAVVGLCNRRSVLRWDLDTFDVRPLRNAGGYAAVLFAEGQNTTFAQARTQGKRVVLMLLRHGARQQVLFLPVPNGPLTLRARREGDLLRAEVNSSHALAVRDIQPQRPRGGYIGLVWGGKAALVRLRAEEQLLPPGTTPLELGQELYDRGQFGEALTRFEEHARLEGGGVSRDHRMQAELMAGCCLARLNRKAEALRLYQTLFYADGPGGQSPWPTLAGVEVVRQRLLMQQERAARDAAVRLLERSPLDRPELYGEALTEDTADTLWKGVGTTVNAEDYLLFLPRTLRERQAQESIIVARGWKPDLGERFRRLWVLDSLGLADRARDEAGALFEIQPGPVERPGPAPLLDDRTRWLGHPRTLEEYCWAARRFGRSREAARQLDELLFERPGVVRKQKIGSLQPLIERCRFLAHHEDWAGADRALDLFFAESARSEVYGMNHWLYEWHSMACLMKGLLRHRRGDAAGAQEAWRAGLADNWWKGLTPDKRAVFEKRKKEYPTAEFTDTNYFLPPVILAALTDTLGDEQGWWLSMWGSNSGDKRHRPLFEAARMPLGAWRGMWSTPEGIRVAWKIAFREVSYPELYREVLYLQGGVMARKAAFAGDVPADRAAFIDRLVRDAVAAYGGEEISPPQAVALFRAWGGDLGDDGWRVSAALDVGLRARMGYVLGCRLRRVLNRPADARQVLEAVRGEAPAGGELRRWIDEELGRLRR